MKSLLFLIISFLLLGTFQLRAYNVIIEMNTNITTADSISTKTQEPFNHQLWDDLLQKHVSNDGKVNYKGFLADKKRLNQYISKLSKNTPKSTWSKAEKLAYWINAYNALTVDLIVRNYPIRSIKDIKNPWKQRLWTLGDTTYDLHDIEHEILRKMNEPRIHFAIVCAAVSCPILQNKAFTASNLELQLDQAARTFINDSAKNSISKEQLELSKIFQWFTKDFKHGSSLIDYLNQFSNVHISAKAKTHYKDYIWDLNE
ncbi:DUF547 domain-containing protein [Tamlana sp. 2_MG-2023]|uniref:DUF547 domain-containing protein n=1 Tax=unclassified Tamlana TaxID=2614803 RepID=UPI0026E42059|nr:MULTISPECIES: DUF547 domain-containing protein [unclassified Tamlana]MDO6760924.1 DUF547 domain-containing protein [Tamlana sp. 2_MG-2023]MDO6791180.1 DUF547 domain-containing protein [Tamlana sp. 1_MG-2023]